MITNLKTLIDNLPHGRSLGAFNTFNLEVTRAIINAASEARSPLIIQLSEKSLNYAGLTTIYYLINDLDKENKVKSGIAIHLDHGKDQTLIKKCIDIGFSSIHFDGSELPLKKNIELSKKIVQYAHRRRVFVQGEVGAIFGKEGLLKFDKIATKEKYLTKPAEAEEFVKKTHVDTLAISVGSLHGLFKGEENLNLERIREIKKITNDLPLVLHGTSGVTTVELKQAMKAGITIFNLDTILRVGFTGAIKKVLSREGKIIDPRIYLGEATQAVKEEVKKYLKIFNKN